MLPNPNRAAKEAIPITLSQGEISEFVKRFTALDDGKKGFVTVNDLRNSLKVTTKTNFAYFNFSRLHK